MLSGWSFRTKHMVTSEPGVIQVVADFDTLRAAVAAVVLDEVAISTGLQAPVVWRELPLEGAR